MLSQDRDRIVESFHWVLAQQPFEGPITDYGCYTGTLLRLIARLQPEVKLRGIDTADNLVKIGNSLSTDITTIKLVVGDSRSFAGKTLNGTILSICGLEVPWQPSMSEEANRAVTPSDPVRQYIHSVAFDSLVNWRRQLKDGGALLFMARLATLPAIAAFILEAASVGFVIDFSRSKYLRAGEYFFPALRFVAGQPCEVDIAPLHDWLALPDLDVTMGILLGFEE